MAINNQLAKKKDATTCIYRVGNEEIRLTPNIVKQYLVSGDASKVTNEEVMMFMSMCKYQGLNPFVRDAYLIKFGSAPASIVVGKTALEKRAMHNSRYRGFSAGIIVITAQGQIEKRKGTFYLDGESLVGGWAQVYVEGFEVPVEADVTIGEYAKRRADGKLQGSWATMPATMIRKVAKAQALREAFPDELGNLYVSEEIGVADNDGDINIPEQVVEESTETINDAPEPKAQEEVETSGIDFDSLMEG